ncbi:MAG: FkbM family methyltransferase, partial [Pseudomonadota bacterium]
MVTHTLKRFVIKAGRSILRPFYKTHRIHFDDKEIAFALQDTHTYNWFIRYAFRKYNWHEPSITQFMLDLPPEINVLIDVGAHLGYFSVVFSTRTDNTSFAVELDPTNFSLLEQTVKSAKGVQGKIETLNLGISDNDFTAQMPISKASPTASLGRVTNKTNGIKPVRVTTLDKLCEEQKISPKIIKIDVEGYEWEFLVGGERTIR